MSGFAGFQAHPVDWSVPSNSRQEAGDAASRDSGGAGEQAQPG